MNEGQFIAKISNYGLQETSKGNVLAVIQFEFLDEESKKQKLSWRGSFNGGALEITLKTLLICGLVGNDPTVIADGPTSGTLNQEKEFSITVKHEYGQDGKAYWKVAWVNEVGFSNLLNKAGAAAKLGDLRGQVAALRKETGYDKKPEIKQEKLEEVPF